MPRVQTLGTDRTCTQTPGLMRARRHRVRALGPQWQPPSNPVQSTFPPPPKQEAGAEHLRAERIL